MQLLAQLSASSQSLPGPGATTNSFSPVLRLSGDRVQKVAYED